MRNPARPTNPFMATAAVALVFSANSVAFAAEPPPVASSGSPLPANRTPQNGGDTSGGEAANSEINNYRIHPGDVLDITVFQKPELSKSYPVPPDGKIVYPFLGSVKVAGMTTSDLSRQIAERLGKELASPQVTVNLTQRQIFEVSVIGAVRTPGKRPLGDGWHLLNLIADCGGLTVPKPEWATATLVRGGAQAITVDLVRLLANGDPQENVLLQSGDLLLINEVDASRFAMQVLGEVGKPGNVIVPKDGSLLSVITAVGGFTPSAALSHVSLTHNGKTTEIDLRNLMTDGKATPAIASTLAPPTQTGASGTTRVPASVPNSVLPTVASLSTANAPTATTVEDIKVQPGDVLLIPKNKLLVGVMGSVGRSGPQEYPENQSLTVLRALTLAGGASGGADLKNAKLIRPRPGSTGEVDIQSINLEDLLKGKSAKSETRDIDMKPGDMLFIPERTPGRQGFTLREALGYVPLLGFFVR